MRGGLIVATPDEVYNAVVTAMPDLDWARADTADEVRLWMETQPTSLVPPLVIVSTADAAETNGVLAYLRGRSGRQVHVPILLLQPEGTPTDFLPGAEPDDVASVGDIPAILRRAQLLWQWSTARVQVQHLKRYVPAPLFASIVRDALPQPQRAELAVLFGDIRSFTDAADFSNSEGAMQVLNDYFRAATRTVHKHKGVIDKFTGDGVLAYFGDNAGGPSSKAAVHTALDLQIELEGLRVVWFERGVLPVGLGIGVTTGQVLVGSIGDAARADYTVVGSTVNLAARLQGLARGGEIVICSRTRALLGDAFVLEPPITAKSKGFDDPIDVYKVRGRR